MQNICKFDVIDTKAPYELMRTMIYYFIICSDATSTLNGSAPPPPLPEYEKSKKKFSAEEISTSGGSAAKRIRNDSIDAIELTSKKSRQSLAEVKHIAKIEFNDCDIEQTSKKPSESHDDTESIVSSSFEKTQSSTRPKSENKTSTPNSSMKQLSAPNVSAIGSAETPSNQPFNASNVGRVLRDLLG